MYQHIIKLKSGLTEAEVERIGKIIEDEYYKAPAFLINKSTSKYEFIFEDKSPIEKIFLGTSGIRQAGMIPYISSMITVNQSRNYEEDILASTKKFYGETGLGEFRYVKP